MITFSKESPAPGKLSRRRFLQWSIHLFKPLILMGLLPLFAACATTVKNPQAPDMPANPSYDSLYPYYVEVCALSAIKPKDSSGEEDAGRGVLFLKGVCRDEYASYPTLRMCRASSLELADPDFGTGISVNESFRNVNWVAVPGKKLFFNGNLSRGQVLDKESFQAAVKEAVKQQVFKGIELHEEYLEGKSAGQTTEEFIASRSAGTDYALNFGRTIFCARMPVKEPMIMEMVDYLNELNREYIEGKADYNWGGYHENSTYTIHNTLASAGVWDQRSVKSIKFWQTLKMAVPANEFADLAILANDYKLEDTWNLSKDKVKRKSLLEREWLPSRHGAILSLVEAHRENEIFDPPSSVFVLKAHLLRSKGRKVQKMFQEKRTVDTEANLAHFRSRYETILQERPEDEKKADENLTTPRRQQSMIDRGDPEAGPYGDFVREYYDYIEGELMDVNSKQEKFFPPVDQIQPGS
jgi:hypothetical protein